MSRQPRCNTKDKKKEQKKREFPSRQRSMPALIFPVVILAGALVLRRRGTAKA